MANSSSIALYVLLAPVIVFFLWQMNTAIIPPPPPPSLLRNKRIVLLIAHPDDESMFFSPSLLALTDPALGNHIKVLCLSTGNADGLGETRKQELEAAAVKLGIRKREDIFVMDDPRFKDGMNEKWDTEEIAKVLAQAFAPDALVSTSSGKTKAKPKAKTEGEGEGDGPRATIDTLITFDKHGVSSHPNHIALFHGAKVFLSNLMRNHKGYACPVVMYSLTSINILRKYSFTLDVLPTYFTGVMSGMIEGATGKKKVMRNRNISKAGRKGDRVVFINDVGKYLKARDAMINGHKSQMVWFRHGWISIGRYMVVNDLRREE